MEEHIRFLDDINRRIDVLGLSGERLVHAPFLQDTLANNARKMNQIVSDKEDEIKRIFRQIDDILPLDVFSREDFDRQMHQNAGATAYECELSMRIGKMRHPCSENIDIFLVR